MTNLGMAVAHHRPRARGGSPDDANVIYCCPPCHLAKGAYWHEDDPPHIRLLHPLVDDLARHLREDPTGLLVGLTPEGRFYVDRLRLNREDLVALRRASRELDAEIERALALARESEHLDAEPERDAGPHPTDSPPR